MRSLFVKVSSSHEEYNADCSFALVNVTTDLIALIKKRYEIVAVVAANDNPFAEMRWWNGAASFVEDSDAFDTLEKVFGGQIRNTILYGEYWLEPPTLTPHPFDAVSTELDRMCMDENYVWWAATPKHTGITLETNGLLVKKLLELGKACR